MSANTQMGVSICSGILQCFLEAHVLERGELPTGSQFIKSDTHYSVGDLTVSLAVLVQAAEEGGQS